MQHTSYRLVREPQFVEKISPGTLAMLFRMSALVIANLLVCALMMAGFFIVTG